MVEDWAELEHLISLQIDKAIVLGARPEDIEIAREYLREGKYGLAWDQLVSQIYEYQINIDQDYYNPVEEIAQKMRIGEKEYNLLRELVQ
jgi:hypothetical protein